MTPLFVIGLIATFLLADAAIVSLRRRLGRPDHRPEPYGAEQARMLSRLPVDGLRLPGDVFLNRNHTWTRLGAGDTVRIGIDDFAQRFVGRLDEIDLPEPGREVRRGDVLFEVRQGVRSAKFRAPMGGIVRAANAGLRESPEMLRTSPYRHGWVVEIEPADVQMAIAPLRIARRAKDWMREDLMRLRELVTATSAPATLPDGGLPVDGVMEQADDTTWAAFQTTFLDAD